MQERAIIHRGFYRALDKVPRSLDCLKTLTIKWIGLIFSFPILWADPREEDDSGYGEDIIEFLGFRRIEEQGQEAKDWSKTYLLTQLPEESDLESSG